VRPHRRLSGDGHLHPVVRAWKNPDIAEIRIRDHIGRSLADMIDPANLTIVDADRATASILP
jgi:hypothetical protein